MSAELEAGTDAPMKTQLGSLAEDSQLGEDTAVAVELIDNVVVDLTVELGRLSLRLGALKALRHNEVLSLDRPVGEPLDIRVNGRTIAKGEVVATESRRYGIRITEIVSPRRQQAVS